MSWYRGCCGCDSGGACCKTDDSCAVMTEAECDAISGFYQGDGTVCRDITCSDKCAYLVEPCNRNRTGQTGGGYIIDECTTPTHVPAVDSVLPGSAVGLGNVSCTGTAVWAYEGTSVAWATFYANGGAGGPTGTGAYSNYQTDYTNYSKHFRTDVDCSDFEKYHKWTACATNSTGNSGDCASGYDAGECTDPWTLPIDPLDPACDNRPVNTGQTYNSNNEKLPRAFQYVNGSTRCCYEYAGEFSLPFPSPDNCCASGCDGCFPCGDAEDKCDKYACCNCCADCPGSNACCDSLPDTLTFSWQVTCDDVTDDFCCGGGTETFTQVFTLVENCDGGTGQLYTDCDLAMSAPTTSTISIPAIQCNSSGGACLADVSLANRLTIGTTTCCGGDEQIYTNTLEGTGVDGSPTCDDVPGIGLFALLGWGLFPNDATCVTGVWPLMNHNVQGGAQVWYAPVGCCNLCDDGGEPDCNSSINTGTPRCFSDTPALLPGGDINPAFFFVLENCCPA